MKNWLELFASMKLAVGLLVALAVALAAGTIVEARFGPETAARAVYAAVWFRGLLGLLALNLGASLMTDRGGLTPWRRRRTGFFLTHAAVVIILAGALVTEGFKVEGRLVLWEGQESDAFELRGEVRRSLPFAVRLDAFELEFHPGTRRPATYRSRVSVIGQGEGDRTFTAVIEPNHELSYRGYRLFQSGYRVAGARKMTVLIVTRDPGQPIVFGGYLLLLIGMGTVFATRFARRRPRDRELPAGGAAKAIVCVVFGMLPAAFAGAGELPDPAIVEELRGLPLQHDGRVMPLDTLARETTWRVTGKERWRGIDPVSLVLAWSFEPEWAAEPLVSVGAELARELAFEEEVASFQELSGHPRLAELLAEARAADHPETYLHQQALEVEDRLRRMRSFIHRQAFRVIPVPDDPGAAWRPPRRLRSPAELRAVLRVHQAHDVLAAEMGREIAYNRFRPMRLSGWILAAAALLALLAWRRPNPWLDMLVVAALVTGWGVMTLGLFLRWQIGGRIPAANMYESLLVLGWGAGLLALAALGALRDRFIPLNAAAVAALILALAESLPLDPFIHPLPPVLAGTLWMAIHVPITLLSYALFTLGMLAAHLRIAIAAFRPAHREAALKIDHRLYAYLHAGALLLVAGILTGSVWAASSWGRYWGWDPKEVWSLIAFLAYMAILHGRRAQLLEAFGVAVASIAAFWTILMTYVGVNLVFAEGLHTFGFASHTLVRWMLAAATAEGIFLTVAAFARSRQRLAMV